MRRSLLFATMTFTCAAAALSACGGDDTTAQSGDSGTDSTTSGDSGTPDRSVQDSNAPDTRGGDTGVGTDTGTRDTGTTDSGAMDTGLVDTGLLDTGVLDTGVLDTGVLDTGTPDTGVDAGCVSLTVKNYLSWCSVSVNGGPSLTDAVQTACVAPGTTPLSAMASSAAFILGLWHHTTGDMGSGDPGMVSGGTSSTSVADPPNACVWVCCPFTDGTGCPTMMDQCP